MDERAERNRSAHPRCGLTGLAEHKGERRMTSRATWMALMVAGMAAANSVQAQDSCPSTNNNLWFSNQSTPSTPVDLEDGADYRIYLGKAVGTFRGDFLNAVIIRNGVCLGGHYLNQPAVGGAAGGPVEELVDDATLCLGSGDDYVEVLRTPYDPCGNFELQPFDYGNFSLTIVGGAGSDTLIGADGQDFLIGGSGSDWMTGVSGAGDYLAGGDGGDWLEGSSGNNTTSVGGPGNDFLFDHGGTGDRILGGDGDDYISAGCTDAFVHCGGGGGDVAEFDGFPWSWLGCETTVGPTC